MSLNRLASRLSRTVLTQYRSSPLLFGRHGCKQFHALSEHLATPHLLQNKVIPLQVPFLHHSIQNLSTSQWFGFSSSASPQPNEKDAAQSQENKAGNEAAAASDTEQTEAPVSDGKAESDSEVEIDLSKDDLVKLVGEKELLLSVKQDELEKMRDTVLRTLAEMENVKERTRRQSENDKKFAIKDFAKSLLDVGDNLGRASTAAKESFSKINDSTSTAEAVQQLKILLEGVQMTEKQLSEVFKKYGLVKYDPVDEEFDPNRHNAVFQVPDASKPAGHVAVVLKSGYILHDRVVRPAEVGVTVAVDKEAE